MSVPIHNAYNPALVSAMQDGLTVSQSPAPDGVTALSPETLLAYCAMRLGALDTQIADHMKYQQDRLNERTAVEEVQNVLNGFGTQGPQDGNQMQKCVAAFDKAIAELPKDNPVAAQLAQQRDQMITDYHYSATTTTSTTDDQGNTTTTTTNQPSSSKPADGQWKTTMDPLNNVVADIKSSAEIDLLKLQELVSQRQQAVQLCTGIMGKMDSSLEDQAKAIGR
jgi:hypothetical protein